MATFNEFQRELQRRNISPENAYMFTLIYERLIHLAKEVEQTATAVLAMAETVTGFVELHERTQGELKKLRDHNKTEGIDVRSEPYDS